MGIEPRPHNIRFEPISKKRYTKLQKVTKGTKRYKKVQKGTKRYKDTNVHIHKRTIRYSKVQKTTMSFRGYL